MILSSDTYSFKGDKIAPFPLPQARTVPCPRGGGLHPCLGRVGAPITEIMEVILAEQTHFGTTPSQAVGFVPSPEPCCYLPARPRAAEHPGEDVRGPQCADVGWQEIWLRQMNFSFCLEIPCPEQKHPPWRLRLGEAALQVL